MPIINGVYLKDFTALPGAVADANIIPIAITGDIIAYRTTVSAIVTDARITSKLLTGLSITGSAVLATDTILQAFGKVQNQLNGKQGTITLTTTGTSGAATLVGSTLNIPNYADGGITSLSAIGSTPNANGATITGTVLNLQPASASFGGVVTTLAQTFAGDKTLTGALAGTSATFSGILITPQVKAATSAGLSINANSGTQVADFGAGGSANITFFGGLSGTSATFSGAVGVTGQLTLSSTITNGTYTYTLPSATGTLALVGGAGVGTVTSVAALTLGTTGTDLSSTVANGTTTPVITLNVPTASATNRGALSSADFSTFSAKQNAITLTTTGSSGAATLIGATLNIPIYSTDLSGYVPYTGATQTLQMGTNKGITLTDTGTSVSIAITSSSTGQGALVIDKSVNGNGVVVNNSGIGYGIYANNTSTGSGIAIGNSSTGKGLFIDNAAAATGDPFAYSLNGVANIKAKIDYIGNITGQSFIPSGSTVPTNGMYLSAANTLNFATNSANRLSISSAGAATFTGALSGTSATFSSTGSFLANTGVSTSAKYLEIINTGGNLTFGVNNSAGNTLLSGGAYSSDMYTSGATALRFGTNSTTRLTIASTGEATFSSSVTSTLGSTAANFVSNGATTGAVNAYRVSNTTGAASYGIDSSTGGDLITGGLAYATILQSVSNTALQLGTNQTARLTIAAGGAVTIANLAGSGSRAVLADASGVLSAPVSDISVKQNIVPIGYGLNEIMKMNPVWFHFVDEYKNFGEGRQNGNIAQEIEEIIPEAVFTTKSTGKMGINYDQLHAVYIKAIQELKAEIEILKNN